MKRKNKLILGTAAAALSLMALGVGMYGLNTETKTASADTVATSPYCLTYGYTTVDGTTTSGCPSNFTVYMKASRSSGSQTVYNGYQSNWSQYYFIIDAVNVSDHLSLELYRNGSLYKEQSVSGESDITVNFGTLPSGDYTLKYECRYAKNIFYAYKYYTYEYGFEVDITDPSYTITAGTGSTSYYVNKAITYTATDDNFSHIRYRRGSSSTYSYYYGKSYTVAATEANNGYWYFYAVDTLGNQSAITFRYLDTIAPVGTVTNQDEDTIANGSYTNEPFIYSATDTRTVAYIEYKSPDVTTWTEYPENVSILTSNGWYYFRAIDGAGNVSDEYRVYYDTVRPSGCVYDSVQARGSGYVTNKNYVKYIATDSGSGVGSVYVKKPGSSAFVSYANGSQLTTQGKYYFKAYDNAGNVTGTTHEITLDLTAPVGQLKAGGVNVASGSYTGKSFSYTATDTVGIASYQVKKPNSSTWVSYTAGTALTGAVGWYYFRAYDTAGNVSAESKIYYDTSAPVGYLAIENGDTVLSVDSGISTNADYVQFTAVDTGSGIKAVYVSRNGGTYTVYTNGSQLAVEGEYAFYALNKAGLRSSTYYITLDKTAPEGAIYSENTKWTTSLTTTGAEYIRFDATDALSGVKAYYVKTPDSTEYVECDNATEFTDEGKYQFYAVDEAGNESSVYSITVDHTAPTGQLYINGQPAEDNNGYTNAEYISFVFDSGTGYIIAPGKASANYISGTTCSDEGRYCIWTQDVVGQAGCIVVIDRKPKELTLTGVNNGYAWGDVELTWTDGDETVDAPVDTITINGELYTGGTVYTLNNCVYEIVCTDMAGNVWSTSFKAIRDDITTETVVKQYYEAADSTGTYYAFATFDEAAEFALYPERETYQIKEWNTETWDQGIPMDTVDSVNAKNGTYYVYKSADDPEKLVAYFTFERMDAVALEYAKKNVKSYYYWEKDPADCIDGRSVDAYYGQNKIVAASVELKEGLIYTLDGVGYTEFVITEAGKHTLLIEDGYGGATEYEIYILDSAPTIQYALGNNSPTTAEYDRTYYFSDRVAISVPFEGDEFAMFEVFNCDTGESLGYFDIANACYIEESGRYAVNSMNHYGISETFNFIVSMNAPTITATKNEEAKRLDVAIAESVDKESNITFFEISKSTDGGETWEILTKDDYGTEIALDTFEYRFRTSGIYKVTVMDEFRTGFEAVTYAENYTQPNPVGVLSGVKDGGITNGTVIFVWTDEAAVQLTKNGVAIEYASGQELTEDGIYTLNFSNYDGYKVTYTFEIDTVAPVVTLEGARNGEYVNAGVKAYFADDEIAELFKNEVSLGAYLAGSNITEDGEYRIVVKDKANNETAVTFTIDTIVDWNININEKGLANSVTVTANEVVEVVLTKNGETMEYTLGDAITETGEYSILLTDALGNTASRNFAIVEPIVKAFEHNFDDVPNFEKVLVNGEDKRLNYGTLELFADGIYEVGVVAGGETYYFTVTVDSTLPSIALEGVENGGETNGNVRIVETGETASLKVYLNDEEIAYTLGEELTAEGEYLAVAVDLANNTAEVSFAIDKTAPTLILNGVENDGETKNGVSLSDLSETATVVVTKDGKEIKYTFGEELNGAGRYVITVTDACGNVSEYAFEITKGISGWAIAGIVVGSLVLLGGVVVFILKKRGVI